MLVGGEKGCSAAIIYASLQMIAQKAHEWAHRTRIHIFDADVYKAFECLKPSVAAKAMRELKVHPTIRAAWLKENQQLEFRPKLLGEDVSLCQLLHFHALRQGGPDSMKAWNLTLHNLMAPLHKKWEREGKGIVFPPAHTRWTHLIWVDGITLMAAT